MYADTDLKFDQPQARVVFDRDKLRSQGVDMSQAGRDLSVLLEWKLRRQRAFRSSWDEVTRSFLR